MPMPDDLREGYQRFRQDRFSIEADLYRSLAKEQRPHSLIIGCADSRVDPATIFAAMPGELFVVRNVAALVPPCEMHGTYHGTSAAIEFAISGLSVERIVVLGHGLCGGVAAALAAAEDRPVGQFVGPWVELLAAKREKLLGEMPDASHTFRQKALEQLAVKQSLENLMTYPFVNSAIDQSRLGLEGAWFSIADGCLEWLDQERSVFEIVRDGPDQETH
ncbi:MAG: carbonic anhydrase [Hyphomicrobiaceae bacterium]